MSFELSPKAVLSGLDQIHAWVGKLAHKRVAVLCHGATRNRAQQHILELIRAIEHLTVTVILAPEHGLWGVAQDMIAVSNQEYQGIPVVSLYGTTVASLTPKDTDLKNVDSVVIDLVDIGTRYYTFAATAVMVATQAALLGKQVIVLDRPNPLGGVVLEGGRILPAYHSLVGAFDLPVRHGLTLGEIVHWQLQEKGLSCEVTRITGWQRRQTFPTWQIDWPWPSPNMPHFTTAMLYPGMCLIEGTELSEGRGTTRPLEILGAPFIDGHALAKRLNDLQFPGIQFSQLTFRPMYQKWAHEICHGVWLHVTDGEKLRALEAVCRIIGVIHDTYPEHFAWRTRAYEFVDNIPAIDLLTGDDEFRQRIKGGKKLAPLFERWHDEGTAFSKKHAAFLLYK